MLRVAGLPVAGIVYLDEFAEAILLPHGVVKGHGIGWTMESYGNFDLAGWECRSRR